MPPTSWLQVYDRWWPFVLRRTVCVIVVVVIVAADSNTLWRWCPEVEETPAGMLVTPACQRPSDSGACRVSSTSTLGVYW